MKRHLIEQLVAWKGNSRRKPLILKGVRQTGKTYLLEEFGNKHFDNYHIINFEQQSSAQKLFDGDLIPSDILDGLKFLLGKPIDIQNDLVIFDEIQACPRALTSLKYFCEDMPELALCSAGSLLGLHLGDGSFPVGKVDMLHLHPMKFSEFLLGIGDEMAYNAIIDCNFSKGLPTGAHPRLWERLKQYFITGGLPEVVSIFSETQNNMYDATQTVRKKQTQLIKAYYSDIAKHSGKINAMHIDRTWRSVPTQLSSTQDGDAKKFKFKGIIPGINRYRQLVDVIDWLEAAELIIKIPFVNSVNVPLLAYTKENQFKLNLFDIGILGAMSNLDPKTILDYEYGTYKGFFAENFVAQQLISSSNPQLFSWQENRAEIEFLMQKEGNIIPIEVKAGHITKAKSLQNFIQKYQVKKSYILSGREMKVENNNHIQYLPLYFAEFMTDIA